GIGAHSEKGVVANRPAIHQEFKIEEDKEVYMLTYFRQRYPTRIEIDSVGKIIEVPLPDPIAIENYILPCPTTDVSGHRSTITTRYGINPRVTRMFAGVLMGFGGF
ncbi:MAG: hypothetical protein LIO97_08240, partial [Tannerellaceae bacterium]|nr:hypothetical protein [Tannerellaceae bacterium]